MPKEGFEPSRAFAHTALNRARLAGFRHFGAVGDEQISFYPLPYSIGSIFSFTNQSSAFQKRPDGSDTGAIRNPFTERSTTYT